VSFDAAYYLAQLQALLPPGIAWPREPGALSDTLAALAEEMARVDGRAEDLQDEADPRSTVELLGDWERAFGLPDPCTDLPDAYGERVDALVGKVTRIGGQSPSYFIAVAARLGFTVTITEFDPFTVDDTVGDVLSGEEWQFAWRVNAPAETVSYFTVDSYVTERLADWGNERLECAIARLKPAHTTVLYAYGA
jgi:uncharacterized protein YmfQ (DUF2313 family)